MTRNHGDYLRIKHAIRHSRGGHCYPPSALDRMQPRELFATARLFAATMYRGKLPPALPGNPADQPLPPVHPLARVGPATKANHHALLTPPEDSDL